jgi:hypothetical protein
MRVQREVFNYLCRRDTLEKSVSNCGASNDADDHVWQLIERLREEANNLLLEGTLGVGIQPVKSRINQLKHDQGCKKLPKEQGCEILAPFWIQQDLRRPDHSGHEQKSACPVMCYKRKGKGDKVIKALERGEGGRMFRV